MEKSNSIATLLLATALWMAPSLKAEFFYGSAYYPEHVSPEQVKEDARLMKGAHFNVARMGDFAWFEMQPEPNAYRFDCFRHAVQTLANEGIYTMLCTPTAAVPKWMYDRHPEIMQVDANGVRKPYGKRRHACLNNPVYRSYSEKIATRLAQAFASNRNVIAYQIDNELGAEEPYCYCEHCKKRFSEWLQKKYGTIEKLNQAWGTTFWSQTLTDFNQAWLPRKGDNPSVFQDFQIFESDVIIDFFNLQRNAIKRIVPNARVTHNICSSGFLYQIDLYKLAQTCDFLSIDNYPYTWTLENEYGNRNATIFSPAMASLALSQIRGTKQLPFWVTEAQIGRTGGMQRNLLQPGIVRLWSHQEFAHGAEGICFFLWKTFESGHEHLISGVVEADNQPRRKYYEAQKTGQELHQLYQQVGQLMPQADAAIIRDFHCDWAFEDGRFSADFRYMRHLYSYYKALREQGITTDIIPSEEDFSKYKLLIVPAQVVVKDDFGRRLQEAARKGTHIVLTCMSGLRSPNLKFIGSLVQQELTQLAGIEIEEQHSYFNQRPTTLTMDGKAFDCGLWFDLISCPSAQPLASFDSQFFKGKPAFTLNLYGKGKVFYVATIPSAEAVFAMTRKVIDQTQLAPTVTTTSKEVEITQTYSLKNRKKYFYILNFSDQPQTIELSKPLKRLNQKESLSGRVDVPAMEYLILSE